jgi:hypothetical protein
MTLLCLVAFLESKKGVSQKVYFAPFLAASWRCSLMQSTTGAGDSVCQLASPIIVLPSGLVTLQLRNDTNPMETEYADEQVEGERCQYVDL